MKSKSPEKSQTQFMCPDLANMLDPRQGLYRLAERIDWEEFEREFAGLYSVKGRPAKPVRLMVSLLMLKQIDDLSDEEVCEKWTQNPYYQYFSGGKEFVWQMPCDPSDLVYFRKRIGSAGAEKVLEVSVKLHGVAAEESEVIADTTVQEKNITFPTDSKQHAKIIKKCVKLARLEAVTLRRSYKRTVPKLLKAQHNRTHPKRAKAARKAARRLKTIAGALVRELKRKLRQEALGKHTADLELYARVIAQQRSDTGKIYSLHEPKVSCISKGKEHHKYEFGQKAGIIKTKTGGIITGAMSFAGNPYDGHTLAPALEQHTRLTGSVPKVALVDKGYQGHSRIGVTEVIIPKKGSKKQSSYQKHKARKRMRKRAGIEPVIGHLKSDFGLKRNFLKGLEGDSINVMLAAAAFNFNKWIKSLWRDILEALLPPDYYASVRLTPQH